jgi:ParB-like chromosome segregation protein Spo0J
MKFYNEIVNAEGGMLALMDQPSCARSKMKSVEKIKKSAIAAFEGLDKLSFEDRVTAINEIREALQVYSPFAAEPVDFVKWVPAQNVHSNDYNPNSVAPPEMELLRLSIMADGYTQPIVTHKVDALHEVVDGFHRNRVGKECDDVRKRVHGYLPVVQIRAEQTDKADRMSSTIRHNRARGKHRIDAMSDIVIELKRRNWTTDRICRELGMDQDEVLRLCQITGLAELFSDQEFSKSWDVEGEVTESDFVELSDDITFFGEEINEFRTVNTSDKTRIFHTYDKWECHKAGFYATSFEGKTKTECNAMYREFLSDLPRFEAALEAVITQWKYSCEHYLTNVAMNRIAWLGQASMCYATGVPSEFRGGFSLLNKKQQKEANDIALKYLNKWLFANGRTPISMEEAMSGDRQSDIY